MQKKQTKADSGRLHITQQYRDRGGMSYDFGSRLRLRVFPRENDMDPADWRVEARTSETPEVITGWGMTRADALEETSRTWTVEAPKRGLPALDWAIVTEELKAVRAL
jgi:hypothetical protein